jgi:hypothetical protein
MNPPGLHPGGMWEHSKGRESACLIVQAVAQNYIKPDRENGKYL